MDLYLPADYLNLREELDDRRDAAPVESRKTPATNAHDDPDPLWRAL